MNKHSKGLDIKYIWVTFKTMNNKLKYQEEHTSLSIDWLKYNCCGCCLSSEEKNKFFLKKYKFQIKNAPNPDNIIWKNLETSSKQRFCLKLFSYLVTLIVLFGSFAFISWVNK